MSQHWQEHLEQRQTALKNQSLWRQRRELSSPQQAEITLAVNGHSLINFSSNDYLGFANHPSLIQAMSAAARQWGVGSGASHLVNGHQTPHQDLETELAKFVGAEQALLFSTGYMANLAIPSAFLSRHDLIIQDKLNHASLIDAAQLSSARLLRYQHADNQHADQILQKVSHQKSMISTDGIFSMDGDMAPLQQLKKICEKHDSLLFIDDAHGLGVLGETGRGSLELEDMTATGNTLLMGTLGKGFGSFGAFVAGDTLLIEQLIQSARTYIYTTALPAPVAAVSKQALVLLHDEGSARRQALQQRIDQFKQGTEDLSFSLLPSNSPIQPMVIGNENATLAASHYLYEQGFYVTAIRPPTVPKGTARLRFTLSAEHTESHIEHLLSTLASAPFQALIKTANSS